MPLVIKSFRGRHTHTYTQAHMHTNVVDKRNFKKSGMCQQPYVTGFRKTDHIVTIDIARNTDLKY